jgi:hypothetical protein
VLSLPLRRRGVTFCRGIRAKPYRAELTRGDGDKVPPPRFFATAEEAALAVARHRAAFPSPKAAHARPPTTAMLVEAREVQDNGEMQEVQEVRGAEVQEVQVVSLS